MAYRHQLHFREAVVCLDNALDSAREKDDDIKDEIWREIATCKYAWWQRDATLRQERRDQFAERMTTLIAFWHKVHDDGEASNLVSRSFMPCRLLLHAEAHVPRGGHCPELCFAS